MNFLSRTRLGQSGTPASVTERWGMAAEAIAAVARVKGVLTNPATLKHEMALPDGAFTERQFVEAAKKIGLRCRIRRNLDYDRLIGLKKPTIVINKDGECEILAFCDAERARVVEARGGRTKVMSHTAFQETWSATVCLLDKDHERQSADERLSRSWIGEVLKFYKGALGSILLTSVFLQLMGLASPLLFQVIIDKVLVHRSNSTLNVVIIAMILVAVIEAILQILRSYGISHTSAKIDVLLGTGLFRHLFRLPMAYFDSRPAGQTVARIRELENIRSFMTSQGMTSIIDGAFALLYIGVLAIYSLKLTAVVVLFLPVFFLFTTMIRIPVKSLIVDKFSTGAGMQQHLIESILGAHTIKAMALEPLTLKRWEEKIVAYVKAASNTSVVGGIGSAGIQLISKLCTAAVIFLGARLVMDSELTVGSLVAFNMITNQLMSPAVRLAGAWQDIQQVQVSLDRIGDVLRQDREVQPKAASALPPIKGKIELTNVVFRYSSLSPEVLKGISLTIPAGQVVGIIGPSGSGKSTLSKLIQRMYLLEQGKIKIDDTDISQVATDWFRRQIGVVLQETMLFNRTIHENIALGNPFIRRERVVELAMLAGAHEFITQFPMGYDTDVTERGSNLSGGQRQRIAIARALALDPKILILDEATSALDYESERAIQDNMKGICQGRTVIIVAHRLAAVRDCQRIIGLSGGRVVEDGPPAELMANAGGLFAGMLKAQEGPGADGR